MRKMQFGLIGLALCLGSGCVVVNPKGDVSMSPFPDSWTFGKKKSKVAYGPTLEEVVEQQQKVVKKLQKQEWTGLVEENAKWTKQVRTLSGYANTTHDPARFRASCDQLLAGTQKIRDAALRQDAAACNAAIQSCDPVLDGLSRDFPTDGPVMYASPVSPPPPAAAPYGPPPRTSVNVTVP